MQTPAREVLDFWFGASGSTEHGTQRKQWFTKDSGFDALIRDRFGSSIEAALAGGLREWDGQPSTALARILVLDQFTRNSFRGTPRAFDGDALALAAARALVDSGAHSTLSPLQRSFAYLPFEHAEDLAMQDASVRLFAALASDAPELAGLLEWAQRHRDVIVRFGRFPHRNAILGRVDTEAEIAFLAGSGSRF